MINHRRYIKIDYTGLLGSFIASWILHCILFAIAATTTIFYPPTADREFISVDLFFASPSPVATLQESTQRTSLQTAEPAATGDSEADASLPVTAAQTETSSADNDLELISVAAPKPEKKKKVPPAESPSPPVTPKVVKVIKVPPPTPVIIPAAEKTPEAEPEKEAVKPPAAEAVPLPVPTVQPKSPEQSEQEKLAAENEKIRRQQEIEQQAVKERAQEEARAAKIARAAELEKQEAEKAAKVKLAAKKAKTERAAAEKARREQLARLKREEEKAAKEKLARERVAAEKTAKEKLEHTRLAANILKNEALSVKPTNGSQAVSSVKAGSAVIAATVTPEKPPTPAAATNTENILKNQTEHKGLALPPVNGDLKLIITSEENLTVKVLFVSYPRARHDKPLTRKEAREQQKLSPIVVRTAKNTLEAVIERSREGIYIFLVEQQGSKPAHGKFSLKLFETRNKSITGREISGPTEVARVLMPEGILWEDDTAFSGNIEDSDSVTKFNSESGLVWKEYRR